MASRGLLQKKNVEIQFNHVSLCARLRGSGKPSIFIAVLEDRVTDPSMAELLFGRKCDITPLGN